VIYLAWKLRDDFLRGATDSLKPKEYGRAGWGSLGNCVFHAKGTTRQDPEIRERMAHLRKKVQDSEFNASVFQVTEQLS